jgi:hypothetical protein
VSSRERYSYEAVQMSRIYLRRSTPKEPTELVLVDENGSSTVVQLTMDQLRSLTRDFTAHFFSNN